MGPPLESPFDGNLIDCDLFHDEQLTLAAAVLQQQPAAISYHLLFLITWHDKNCKSNPIVQRRIIQQQQHKSSISPSPPNNHLPSHIPKSNHCQTNYQSSTLQYKMVLHQRHNQHSLAIHVYALEIWGTIAVSVAKITAIHPHYYGKSSHLVPLP